MKRNGNNDWIEKTKCIGKEDSLYQHEDCKKCYEKYVYASKLYIYNNEEWESVCPSGNKTYGMKFCSIRSMTDAISGRKIR